MIGGRLRLEEQIGGGAFGDVFEATDVRTRERLAVKLEELSVGQLENEAWAYERLEGSAALVPAVRDVLTHGSKGALVLELLGPSLEQLVSGSLGLKTLLSVAEQLLAQLQAVHSTGLLHLDVKPGNFALGKGKKLSQFHVLDFGLSREYQGSDGAHIARREDEVPRGTAKYMSVRQHRGVTPSRRDDLEALAYLLLDLHHGGLPWDAHDMRRSSRAMHDSVAELKESVPLEELCEGLPVEFSEFLSYARGLGFEEAPDYAQWREAFRERAFSEGFAPDGIYEWTEDLLAEEGLTAEDVTFYKVNSSRSLASLSTTEGSPTTSPSLGPLELDVQVDGFQGI
jgi:serine/threonine protein kinase